MPMEMVMLNDHLYSNPYEAAHSIACLFSHWKCECGSVCANVCLLHISILPGKDSISSYDTIYVHNMLGGDEIFLLSNVMCNLFKCGM